MKRPTFAEVMAAIGYSLGKLMLAVPSVKRASRAGVKILIFGSGAYLAWYLMPFAIANAAALPAVNLSVIALVLSLGLLFFGAAAFAYVLFAALSRVAATDPGIRNDLQHILQKVAHPLRTVAPDAETTSLGGSFTPYDEDRASMQEQFDELVKSGILNKDDRLDDILKAGEFDFETIRDKARGE